jgi:hypothetical protein
MRYMINVDLETKNLSGGKPECPSKMHSDLGRHYDLTVHALDCGSRSRPAHRPPTRYWDDNSGEGYALDALLERIRELRAHHSNAYPRRCLSCDVGAHKPEWD